MQSRSLACYLHNHPACNPPSLVSRHASTALPTQVDYVHMQQGEARTDMAGKNQKKARQKKKICAKSSKIGADRRVLRLGCL